MPNEAHSALAPSMNRAMPESSASLRAFVPALGSGSPVKVRSRHCGDGLGTEDMTAKRLGHLR